MDDQRTDRESGGAVNDRSSALAWCLAATLLVFVTASCISGDWLRTSMYMIPAAVTIALAWYGIRRGREK